jgi:hypothetical protein
MLEAKEENQYIYAMHTIKRGQQPQIIYYRLDAPYRRTY